MIHVPFFIATTGLGGWTKCAFISLCAQHFVSFLKSNTVSSSAVVGKLGGLSGLAGVVRGQFVVLDAKTSGFMRQRTSFDRTAKVFTSRHQGSL